MAVVCGEGANVSLKCCLCTCDAVDSEKLKIIQEAEWTRYHAVGKCYCHLQYNKGFPVHFLSVSSNVLCQQGVGILFQRTVYAADTSPVW